MLDILYYHLASVKVILVWWRGLASAYRRQFARRLASLWHMPRANAILTIAPDDATEIC